MALIFLFQKVTFYEIAQLTDIFKFSGRYTSFDFEPADMETESRLNFTTTLIDKFNNLNKVVYSDNIIDAINDNILPLNSGDLLMEIRTKMEIIRAN
jgi:hypothetical protein